MRRAILTTAGCVLAAVSAWAGPLDKKLLAADTTWLVHLDCEAALSSTIGQFVASHRDDPCFADMVRLETELGLNLWTDLKAVTVFGAGGEGNDAVAVFVTTPAVDTLVAERGKRDKTFSALETDGHRLYTWQEGGQDRFAAVLRGQGGGGERIALASANKARLLRCIDVVAKGAPNLETPAQPGCASWTPKPGSILFGATVRSKGPLAQGQGALVQKIEEIVVDLGEADAAIAADVRLTIQNAEDVTPAVQIIQGTMALVAGQLGSAAAPEKRAASEFARGVRVSAEGTTITVHAQCDSGLARKAMQALGETRRKAVATERPKDTSTERSGTR
jgi:hypothetical protein